MIISSSRTPKKSLYVIGANLISTLKEQQFVCISPLDLFDNYKETHGSISFAYFNFGLDWLFMLGVIELTKSGDIKLCN